MALGQEMMNSKIQNGIEPVEIRESPYMSMLEVQKHSSPEDPNGGVR